MDAAPQVASADHTPPPAPAAVAPTPAHATDLGGGREAAPAPRSDLVGRLVRSAKESVWASIAGKASAIGTGMLGLAAIGAWSTLAGAGVPVTTPVPARASADAHGDWVAPAHPAGSGAPASSGPSPGTAPEIAPGVPAKASQGGATTGDPPPAPGAAPPGLTADGKVVLNTATADDLRKLPRVGPKRAQAIVELRTRLGKFRKATDLLRVRGIGRKTLAVMLPKLVVDPP